jgi:hypothetical protein
MQDLYSCAAARRPALGQISTYQRQKGYKQDWQHDFIFSGVIR